MNINVSQLGSNSSLICVSMLDQTLESGAASVDWRLSTPGRIYSDSIHNGSYLYPDYSASISARETADVKIKWRGDIVLN